MYEQASVGSQYTKSGYDDLKKSLLELSENFENGKNYTDGNNTLMDVINAPTDIETEENVLLFSCSR